MIFHILSLLLFIFHLGESLSSQRVDYVIPFEYPLYTQCNSSWANDIMDTKTICDVGCLMSSTSMAIAGSNILIPDSTTDLVASDPHTLNIWLKDNGGYDGSNDLIESVVPEINPDRITWPPDGMHKTNDITYNVVSAYIMKGRIMIANVNNGTHFVLLTGFDPEGQDMFSANDPANRETAFSYTKDIVGYRIFDMIRS